MIDEEIPDVTELVTGPNAPLEEVTLTDPTDDPVTKAKAYELYLNSSMSPQEIGLELAVPAKKVLLWIQRNGWCERKKQMDDELQAQAEAAYRKRRKFLIDNQLDVATRHLGLSKKLEDAIEGVVDAASKDNRQLETMAIQRLSKALADVTSVSSRAVGLEAADNTLGKKAPDERKPLLVLNFGTPQVPKDITDQVEVSRGRDSH